MEKEKITTLYKHTYTYTFESFFNVNVEKIEVYDNGDHYVDYCNEFVTNKNAIGRINIHNESMYLHEENINFYIDALIKKRKDAITKQNHFINTCDKYKNNLITEKRPKVKIYTYSYSFSGGMSVFEHEAKEHDTFYCVNTTTTIDKDLIDEIINPGTGTLGMYSLEKNEEKFKKKVIEYIKETS